MAQWIRHLTTNQGIPGSNPGGVEFFSLEYKSSNALKISESSIMKKSCYFPSLFSFLLSINRDKKKIYSLVFEQLLPVKKQRVSPFYLMV